MTSGPYFARKQTVYMKTGDCERRISRADFPDSAEKFAAELNRQADVVRKIQKLVAGLEWAGGTVTEDSDDPGLQHCPCCNVHPPELHDNKCPLQCAIIEIEILAEDLGLAGGIS